MPRQTPTTHTISFPHDTLRGYSLIELAVVVTIVALLVGGILMGSNLMHAAALKSTVTQMQEVGSALALFKEKYSGYPGDMTNASTFWPNCDPTPSICDGNGDRKIRWNFDPATREDLRAWQQMAAAGVIQGTYPGMPNALGRTVPGVSNPKPALEGSGFQLQYSDSDDPIYQTLGHFIGLTSGTPRPYLNNVGAGGPTTLDVYSMDVKYDDGLASSGSIYGHGSCTTKDYTDVPPSDYISTDMEAPCELFFWLEKRN